MIRLNMLLAAAALIASAGVAWVGQPTLQDQLRWRGPELDATLASRKIHLDPAEVNLLLHDPQVRTQLLDVRQEAEYNVFHLKGAKRIEVDDLLSPETSPKFDAKALKIFIAHDEAQAELAWRRTTAAGLRNAYVLAGGVDLWLSIYRDGEPDAQPREAGPDLHGFSAALGDRLSFAYPELTLAKERTYETKAKRLTKAAKPAGGCGG